MTPCRWAKSVLFVGTLLCLLRGAPACIGGDRMGAVAEGPNVLLVTVDTLRADRLGCYGYRLPTSPNIDHLAQRGVRFVDCTAQWPKTWPSMASLMTGAYPKTTGMKYRRRKMHPSLLLLSEVFQKHGYRTGAVVANFNVGKTLGFDQGFDHFVESWQEAWGREAGDAPFPDRTGFVKRYTNARIVTDQALAWLRSVDHSRPFFLWLHYMDPHGPYVPPAGYREYFQGAHRPEPTALENLPRYQVLTDPRSRRQLTDVGSYRAQYDREVRFLDDELGRLFRALGRIAVDDRDTLLVFSADHGESLGEHDYYLDHGKFSYQACARVPLVVVWEGRLPAGRIVEQPVGLINVSATILELTGIEAPGTFEGRSLAAMMEEGSGAAGPAYVFMEAGYREPTQLTVRYGRWKLIHVRSEEDRRQMNGSAYELYDVVADAGELNNLAADQPERVTHLGRILGAWFTGGPRRPERGEEVDLRSLSPEDREMLRSLGYIP